MNELIIYAVIFYLVIVFAGFGVNFYNVKMSKQEYCF